MSKHNELGKNGEKIARQFLIDKGHHILAVNFRYGHKEIDIISAVRDMVIFSEIKTRSSLYYSFPEEAVTTAKQMLIKSAAEHFLDDHPGFRQCRFDVISIVLRSNELIQIRHYEDVFC
ncbi:MAG TPA: YraN family protein [Edaphocola sp.]|nr:YraN family protein [Edaphocola sp.]